MNTAKETILITGSSGRIGYPLAKRLARSFNVVAFDRQAPSHPPPSAECMYVDLTSKKNVHHGLQALRELHGDHIASVIHLAAYYDFSGAPNPLYDEVTVKGTSRLLRMLNDFNFDVEQFVFSSTALVHASSAPGIRINEDSPIQSPPKWPYPESKVKTEGVIHTERKDIPAVILRISGVYDDLCHSIPLAQQIQRIYERDPSAYFFPGDPSKGQQPYVHNDDLGDAVSLVVERRRELPPDLTLLIGESESLTYDELQRSFGQLIHNEEWNTKAIPLTAAKVGVRLLNRLPLERPASIPSWMIDTANDNIELDITRARTLLGWEPRHSLRDTLPKMLLALKADPFTWYRENGLDVPLWMKDLMPAPKAPQPKETDMHELEWLDEQVRREIEETATASHASQASGQSKKHHDVMGRQDEAA